MLSVCMCALGEKENMNFLLKHNLSCKVGKGIVICSWMTLATKALSESNTVTQWFQLQEFQSWKGPVSFTEPGLRQFTANTSIVASVCQALLSVLQAQPFIYSSQHRFRYMKNEWKIQGTVFSLTPQRKIGNMSSNIPTFPCRAFKCERKDDSLNSSDDMGKTILIWVNS